MKPVNKIVVKPFINKRNGQFVICIPKKSMPKKMSDDIFKIKHLKIALEDWE